jgi:hypothetical protein
MSGDFSINGLGGINRLQTSGNRSVGNQQSANQPLLGKAQGADTFERSNPLGIPTGGLTIGGVPIKSLDAGSLHPSTVKTLQSAPDKFPPIEGSDEH